MAYTFDRSTYRIPYPPSARAGFELAGRRLPIVDCSEGGLRFEAPQEADLPQLGDEIEGIVHLFSQPEGFRVGGHVVRIEGRAVALSLARPGLPMQALFAEQRYLARRFPARYGSK